MTAKEIYDAAIAKGINSEKAFELALKYQGKKENDVEEILAAAIAVPLMGAVIVDEALGGIPSAIVGGILGFFL